MNKYLVRINDLNEIEEYKKKGISNFLFPLEYFSIGYNAFRLSDLKELDVKVYLLVNRIFDNITLDEFIKIKDDLSFICAIIFEDIAVYEVLKDSGINLIWNQAHFVVNSRSINLWNEKVYSCMLSNELTREEIEYILGSSTKKVILPILGLNMAMYSRRYLLSYYNEFKGLKETKKGILSTNNNISFLAVENEFGTVLFYNKYYNLTHEKFDDDNVLFYYIDPNSLEPQDVYDILDGKEIDYDNRFYNNKTIYKIGDIHD